MRTVDLEWHGPLRIPNLPPTKELETQLAKPGVYIYLRKYSKKDLIVAYAGSARARNKLISRFRTHFVSTLGLGYWIRGENGCYAYRSKDEFCESLNDIDKKVCIAIKETKRIQFYYTCIEEKFIKRAESLLIDQLKRKAKDNEQFICENERSVSYPEDLSPVVFQNKGAREITQLLGVTSLQQGSDAP